MIKLAQRQLRIVELLSDGLTIRQIAEAMGIQVNTVKCLLSRAFKKWQVHSQAELLVKYGVQQSAVKEP